MNFENIISLLKTKRQIFHSEDDLKLAIAFAINELYPKFEIRLERPINIQMIDRNNNEILARAPIDIIVVDQQGMSIPIELKYKTKLTGELEHNNETYRLTNHGATDISRYSFRKDIFRIERYLRSQDLGKIT